MGLEPLIWPLYELYWLLTTRHLTANIFSCIPIFLDNDFCKTINLFIIDIYACSIYLEEKATIKNKQTSINENNHVNVESVFLPSVLDFPSVIWVATASPTDLKGPLFLRALHSQVTGDRLVLWAVLATSHNLPSGLCVCSTAPGLAACSLIEKGWGWSGWRASVTSWWSCLLSWNILRDPRRFIFKQYSHWK